MALIDFNRCLGPAEFECPADSAFVLETEPIPAQVLVQKLVFLHPTGVDAPLGATVARVLRQQRMLPGDATDVLLESVRVGVSELIAQPAEGSGAVPGVSVEAFSGVGSPSDGLFGGGGFVVVPGQRLRLAFRSRSKTSRRIRLAVVVLPMIPAATQAIKPLVGDGGGGS